MLEKQNTKVIKTCNQVGCEEQATHYYVWTEPVCSCFEHAKAAIRIGSAMAFFTPASTFRVLREDELYQEDM